MSASASAFTPAHRAAIDALSKEFAQRTQRAVVAEYGVTDDGRFHDVALCIESLPVGAWGRPGPLVSILAGPGVGGEGFAVMRADGSPLGVGLGLAEALKGARIEGVRECRKMCRGAL